MEVYVTAFQNYLFTYLSTFQSQQILLLLEVVLGLFEKHYF